jgi:hypothetical protein
MFEGLKALGYILLVTGAIFLIWVAYEAYMMSYNGVNPFQ